MGEALKRPENFGKRFETVKPECESADKNFNGAPDAKEFVIGKEIGPLESGRAAIEYTAWGTRERLAPYLEDFASAFSEERFVPRFINNLVKDDVASRAMFNLVKQYHKAGWRADNENPEDYDNLQFFLYDLMSGELMIGRA